MKFTKQLTIHFQVIALELHEDQQFATHLTNISSTHWWHSVLASLVHIEVAILMIGLNISKD